eukprot:TRINITY_DN18227_c0_g1_i1.p1 TRINITY_DN18227_c0_g1~~TRINITY_DN18227_c0_g1_i1.p1  ORF type:complete len:1023 (-),score=207.73 TRINITY_DN18227_c0_g1_i1:57-3125(-)
MLMGSSTGARAVPARPDGNTVEHVTSDADAADLTEERVIAEEHEWLRARSSFLASEPSASTSAASNGNTKFSVALSGGGIRAAAFQAGVLWRLAEAGKLQEVEYIAAVSGGGYLAASFASHLVAAGMPEATSSAEVTGWYLRVVAKMICRMQSNAGGFIRDPFTGAGDVSNWRLLLSRPRDSSSCLPPIFDFPVFLVTLVVTLAMNPLQFCIVWLLPITEVVNSFFGTALRAAFCDTNGEEPKWQILWTWSPVTNFVRFFEVLAAANLAFWLISRLAKSGACWSSSRCYVLFHSALGCALRILAVMLLLSAILFMLTFVQEWRYASPAFPAEPNVTGISRPDCCSLYSRLLASHHTATSCPEILFRNASDKFMATSISGVVELGVAPAPLLPDMQATVLSSNGVQEDSRPAEVNIFRSLLDFVLETRRSLLIFCLIIIVVFLIAGALLLPVDPGYFSSVLSIMGPCVSLVAFVSILQYRVYGPITQQSLMRGQLPFTTEGWNQLVGFSLIAGIFLAPFHNELRRIWHWYYLRTLQTNLFADGQDIALTKLRDHLLCPLLILTGTVTDFRRIDASQPLHRQPSDTISEISFTALHTGSKGTGFIKTPYFRTLAKCTALTGAGCLDALSLSMTHRMRFRFWLEMLNLSWGDYILFDRRSANPFVERLANCLGPEAGRKFRWVTTQLPALFLWLCMQVLLTIGWYKTINASSDQDCQDGKSLILAAVILCAVILSLSFFAYLPGLQCLMVAPIIRQFHQATRFIYRAEKPPALTYVTDGGVQDCTAVVQLMRRRCRRILLVLAAADPGDELAVLRAAMEFAIREKVGSFFDPSGRHRGTDAILEEFSEDKAMPYLHLGIRYGGWNGRMPREEAAPSFGDLFVVKNRLPPSLESTKVQALLTEEEVTGDLQREVDDFENPHRWCTWAQLGGMGCCDFCHRTGCNCGPKFPHLSAANYLWLTPTLFSSLCRLGHEVSAECVCAVTEPQPLPAQPDPVQLVRSLRERDSRNLQQQQGQQLSETEMQLF